MGKKIGKREGRAGIECGGRFGGKDDFGGISAVERLAFNHGRLMGREWKCGGFGGNGYERSPPRFEPLRQCTDGESGGREKWSALGGERNFECASAS